MIRRLLWNPLPFLWHAALVATCALTLGAFRMTLAVDQVRLAVESLSNSNAEKEPEVRRKLLEQYGLWIWDDPFGNGGAQRRMPWPWRDGVIRMNRRTKQITFEG